jgi:outer membrane protein assembly factor BamB
MRKRFLRLLLLVLVLGGVGLWVARAYWDRGILPPSASTDLSATLTPDTWPQVRRTPTNTGFIPQATPYPFQVQWTYRTSKRLLASPAVVEPHVYVTTEDHRTLALHRHTGQLAWAHTHRGPLSSTPAVAGELLIVTTRPGRVMAFNRHSGAVQWETELAGSILASPLVANGTVYIGTTDRKLYALDAATGRQRWVFDTRSAVVVEVAHAGDRVIATTQESMIYVVGAETGHRRLIYDTGLGRHVVAGVAIEGDRAYFGSMRGRVWAIDWRETTYPFERAMLFWKNNLFFWGVLSKPPVQKGTVWSKRVRGNVMHTLAIAHHTLYATTSQGTVFALDTVTGETRWTTDLSMRITAAPTVAGTTVLLGTQNGFVVGLDAQTGAQQWEFRTAGPVTGSPIVAGGIMYVASNDGVLYAVAKAAP